MANGSNELIEIERAGDVARDYAYILPARAYALYKLGLRTELPKALSS